MATLADELYSELIKNDDYRPIRLGLHFLDSIPASDVPGACIAHHRVAQEAHANDVPTRLVPSYAQSRWDHAGFLVIVPYPDWKERGGLGLLHFDRAEDDPDVDESDPGDGQLPDPLYYYPTRHTDPNERANMIFDFAGAEGQKLCELYLNEVYRKIPVLEEWGGLDVVARKAARAKWEAGRKAKRQAGVDVKAEAA